MALTDIVALADLEAELGGGLSAADSTLADSIRLRVEAYVRQYCRWSITEATYTQFLPRWRQVSDELQLPEPFVTSITTVHEDSTARGGSNSGDFPAATLLTEDTDYWLDVHTAGMSEHGILRRYLRAWPGLPRTVKVVYVAGFDATALANKYLFVKDAVMFESMIRYLYAKERQAGGSSGTVVMERMKDYTVRYSDGITASDEWKVANGGGGLMDLTESRLDPIVYYGEML